MFYFDGVEWKLLGKKVTYSTTATVYTDNTAPYKDKLDFKEETLSLTEGQLKRLGIIKNIMSLSPEDVEHFVIEANPDKINSSEFKEKLDLEAQKTDLKKLIDFDNASAEDLEKIRILVQPFFPGVFYSENDLVTYLGGLFLVGEDHISKNTLLPGTEETALLYVEKRPISESSTSSGDGSPEPEVWGGKGSSYNIGARVWHGDKIWISKIDGNKAEPDGDTPYNRFWGLE